MSTKSAPKATPTKSPAAEMAEAIIDLIKEEFGVVLNRKWPDIQRIIEADKEIKINAGIAITDRPAEPGTQASKDNRVKVTISFAEKYSDSTEAPLPDPQQTLFDVVE